VNIPSFDRISDRISRMDGVHVPWRDGHLLGFSRHRHRSSLRTVVLWAIGGLIAGALLAWYFDPDRGSRRRHITRDRLISTFRRTGNGIGRFSHKLGSDAYGWGQKAMHPGISQDQPANDAALARKVESEIFRSRDVPKGRINVNAQEGVVVLRGELNRPEEIRELVAAAGRIPGVRAVENLLHTPGTRAPNKQTASAGD
jgi:BON domain